MTSWQIQGWQNGKGRKNIQSAQASQPSSATQQQHKAAKQAPKQPFPAPPDFLGGACCW